MRKPVRVVSANFLERIGEPASRFYSDYLAYRNGNISRAELIGRLPHVAMVGDSVCMGAYISSIWETFLRTHNWCGNNWFLDTNPTPPGIRSVSRDWRSSLRLLRLNARVSARSLITKVNPRLFSDDFLDAQFVGTN